MVTYQSRRPGERLPVHKQPGAQVIGGSINYNGTLRARATKVGADTALAQIVKLVQEAQNSKAPGQRLADRAAFWLVLVALVGGGLTLAAWLLAGRPFSEAILFAITVVVITCPDALDVPTALAVGRGTLRKMRQNLGWAVGYNAIALPVAAGVFEPALGLVLRPEIAALSMSGSSLIVAVNALALKRLRLPLQHVLRRPCPGPAAVSGCRSGGAATGR